MKKSVSWTVLIYGAVLMVLGYVGYAKGNSLASLYAGTGLGFLLVLSSWAMFAHKKAGGLAALALTVALTAVFSYRYALTNKTIPAILAVLSGAMLLYLLLQIPKWKK